MGDLFPMGTGIGRVRGIVNIMKQHKGHMEMSKLAEEAEEHIDDLLPLIEACKLLGFVVVDESELKLTESGSKLTVSNFSKTIHDRLLDVEPFKSALKIINEGEISSQELFSDLKRRGIMVHGDDTTNSLMLMKLFTRWGVRGKIMSYNPKTDSWSRR